MDTDYRKAANITLIVIGIAFFVRLIFKYALGALAPFILAATIAALISPAAKKLSESLRIPRRIAAVALTLIIFSALSALLYFAASRLALELGAIASKLEGDPEIVSHAIEELNRYLSELGSKFSFIRKILESESLKQLGLDVDRLLPEMISSLTASLTGALPSAAVGVLTRIPDIALFTVVLIISTFYFCADGEEISNTLSSILPDSWQKKLPGIKERLYRTLTGYVKAYLLIMLLTFCQVFLGLSILGVEYAFILSLIIAVVDILPILGTGTIVVPWAIVSFIVSNYKMGIGLLIIYGVVSIVRQIIEPRIVGGSLGLHPLATLASVYVAMRLIGISGIFIGPVIALLVSSFFKGEPSENEENKVEARSAAPK